MQRCSRRWLEHRNPSLAEPYRFPRLGLPDRCSRPCPRYRKPQTGRPAGPSEALLTGGQVASRSGLTAKALRHYDRISLLRPAHVDTANGYRLYRSDQVAEARLVGLLRSLDLPLDKVRTVVAARKDGG